MTPNISFDGNVIYSCYNGEEKTSFNVVNFSHMESANVNQSCQSQNTQKRKSVSFSIISIREHALMIGDHPYCTTGLPLSLDWGSSKTHVVDIDEYEKIRPQRRSGVQMKTTYLERKNLLKRVSGYNESDIKRAGQRNRRRS